MIDRVHIIAICHKARTKMLSSLCKNVLTLTVIISFSSSLGMLWQAYTHTQKEFAITFKAKLPYFHVLRHEGHLFLLSHAYSIDKTLV